MRAALRLAAAGAVGVGAYTRYDEGTARSVTFWYHAFPVWAQYRAVQWRNRDLAKIGVPSWTGLTLGDADANAAYERLHERHALKKKEAQRKSKLHLLAADGPASADEEVSASFMQRV